MAGGRGLETFDLNVNEGDGFRVECVDYDARRGCIKQIVWGGRGDDGLPVAWGLHETVTPAPYTLHPTP